MNLQKVGGLAAIAEAIFYVFAFIIFGAVLEFLPAGSTASQTIEHLSENQLLLSVTNFVIYVLFGIVLSILVLAIYERTKSESAISKLAAVFGFIWVVLVIASGMIFNIGLAAVIKNGAVNPEEAVTLWKMINIIGDSLGGGNEVVGAVWLILLSIAGLKSNTLPKGLVYFGLLVGAFGVGTIYPYGIFAELFGTTQILWFIWVGVVLLKSKKLA
ncbi:hypothetical protein [Fulvivirga lutea]|uniref:DUF4386 family protein n=1 Tax=Fulvivirga lutea TaxID=2810512 RepID=A0A974WIU9_9BACT|nr:hypothetical protein [Fulvivirga lutea]QSE98985.1 hypothetical protein JR347_07840 [Fulvivirga lutea]